MKKNIYKLNNKLLSQEIKNDSYMIEEDSKFIKIFYNGLLVFSSSMIVASVLTSFDISIIVSLLISLPTVGPLSLFGIHKIKEISDRNFKADMQMTHQVVKMFTESKEVDHKITPTSSYFYREINSKEPLKDIDQDAISNINQFLCMINGNYFEEINDTLITKLSREELVDKILEQIVIFASKHNLSSFTITEAESIINGCIFINDDIKKRIIKEYKQSAINIDGRKIYRILNKNFDCNKSLDESIGEMHQEKASTEHHLKMFDVNEVSEYEFLLKCFDLVEENEYGNINEVEWDLQSLCDIMSFMLNTFHTKLTKEKGEYYNSEVVMSFMYNVFVYAQVNKTGKVGLNEIINTFKKWDFFEGLFYLKLEILDAIFEEYKLDYSTHPYRNHKNKNPKNKLLSFPKNQNKTN